jgi:homeobox-leucine zipper protein
MSMEEQEIRSENARLMERSKLTHLASTAMDELIKMAEPDSHLWIKSLERGNEVFNHDEYENIRSPFNTPKPNGFVTEVTRETVMLHTNTAALIETFLDAVCHIIFFTIYISLTDLLDIYCKP